MARSIAHNRTVDRETLVEFLRPRHRAVLITHRSGDRLQSSPVVYGVDPEGLLVVSTYPERAKAVNLRRDRRATVLVLSEDFDGPWVQVDCEAEVLDLPESLDPLVEYYRSIAGEHPDWDEYRRAMLAQGKSLIRLSVLVWGPIAVGGFPARLANG
jgi:PPOX class probable F420-dependent enzyme